MPHTILVTGGAGFIGSHVVRALLEQGFEVIALDLLSNGHAPAALTQGRLVVGSTRDRALLRDVFAEHAVDAVIHCAGLIEVGASVEAPIATYAHNVGGTLALLEAMGDAQVRRLVFSSSAAVYGERQAGALSETSPLAPINPYGRSKAMVERVLEDAAASGDVEAIALRYFNACGATPEVGLGERHEPETHLIPLVLQVATGERPHIAIFGEDYPTPDGTCVRDYVHVKDLAAAHVAATRRLLGGAVRAGFEAFNLGTGRGFSVREIVAAARRVTGRPIAARSAPRRGGDPAVLIADAGRAGEVLGWRPVHSELETILRDAWAFHTSG